MPALALVAGLLLGCNRSGAAVMATPVATRVVVATAPATLAAAETPAPAPQPTSPPTPAAAIGGDVQVFPSDDPLYALALELINESRRAAGLSPVAWDEVAAAAGRGHVVEMAADNTFSHWNLAGLGPEHRYSRAGGLGSVRENLFARASSRPPDDWAAVIREAHAGLMDSPGHRATILDPAQTHVGLAIAFNAATGQMRLAQEFTSHYVTLNQPLPQTAAPGARVVVDGFIDNPHVSNVLLDVAWEPLPRPLSVSELNATGTYMTAAQSFDTRAVGAAFVEEVALDNAGRPGIYHIRIFADVDGEQALVMDHAVWVE